MKITSSLWLSPSIFACLVCTFCLVAAKAPADTVVLPNYAVTNQISNDSEIIFPVVVREQIIYSASEFPAYPIIVNEIRWRPDTSVVGPITATITNIQINFSTTPVQPDQLSPTFAQNIGSDNTVVFSGAMHVASSSTTLSNGTKDFDIDFPLQTPFLFDSSKGNLLIDLHNFTGCSGNLYDNSVANIVDAVSRIVNTSDPNGTSASFTDSGGGVIELIYSPASGALVITAEPTNQIVTISGTATFRVGAEPPPLSYQWFYHDIGHPINDATNSFLTLTNVQADQAGIYFVQISNTNDSIYSENAVLTVISGAPFITAQPVSQVGIIGSDAIFSVSATGSSPLYYYWYFNTNILINSATNPSLTITNIQINQLGKYSVLVSNVFNSTRSSNADLNLGFVVPNYGVTNQIFDDSEAIFTDVLREQIVYKASEFPAYPIIINEISWRPDAIVGGPITTIISNLQVSLSTTTNGPDHLNLTFAQNMGSDDTLVFSGAMGVASSFTTLSNGTKAFDIDLPLQTVFFYDPSKGNLLIDWRNFTGCSPALYNNSVANIVDAVSRIYNTSNPNATSASGSDSGGGIIAIGYGPAPLPPTIAFQPTNQTVTVGGAATFSVIAGPVPLSYQWFYHDIGQPIDEATNSLLTLTNVQTGEAGPYFVQVTGAYGSTYSANAVLTVTTDPPIIVTQPVSRTGFIGTNFTFSVSATGALPLTYQWYFNTNNPIDGATNASLTLTNIQKSQAGAYSVFVTNAYGWTNSTFAFLTVNFTPAPIVVISTNVMGGNSVDVPVVLVANGNENTLTFSMNFNTQQLAYAGITLGSGAGDAALLPSTGQTPNGRLGVSLQLPSNETFALGTQEVVRVTFTSAILTGSSFVITPVNFTNQPVNKLLFDTQNIKLATNFINGTVTISPTVFEADVAPRPTGDQSLDIFDWSQVGGFVAGVDAVTNASEFQRADCAPKSTSGDGQLKVTDWVQAGRYNGTADALVPVGGPTAPVTPTILTGGPRTVSVTAGAAAQGTVLTLPVTLQSQGNENAIGFSLNFDPGLLKYSSTIKGSATASATMNVNTNQVAAGVLGVILALPSGNNFTNGVQEVVRITFKTLTSTTNGIMAFSDAPVLRAISDPLANELPANYSNAIVVINPLPVLSISLANTNALVSWPNWATGFNLQAAGILSAPAWTNVSSPSQTNSSNISITIPALNPGGYFRLQHP